MSCGIIFLSENLNDTAVVSLTTGTENSQFPLSNLKIESCAKKFRSQENAVVIVFDLLQTRTLDAIALHGDTNGQLGMTNASFRSSLTLDFTSSTPTNIPLSAEQRMGYALFTPVSHRYVELTLTGTGSFVELSNIFIGEHINLINQNISISTFSYGFNDRSSMSENNYGQQFIDKRNMTKTLGGSIQYCIKSEQQVLDDMFSRHGKSLPIWLIMDSEGNSIEDGEFKLSIYGYFSERPNWSASGGQTYNTQIEINQAG